MQIRGIKDFPSACCTSSASDPGFDGKSRLGEGHGPGGMYC